MIRKKEGQGTELKMALSANELFSLKWGEFQSFISNSVRSLREVGDFTDVTLVCEDGELEAHRVILSACSSFFQRVRLTDPQMWKSIISIRS